MNASPCVEQVALHRTTAPAHITNTSTRIKLCGMFRDDDMKAVVQAQPDMCGFIIDFAPSHRSITPQRLIELCAKLDALEAESTHETAPDLTAQPTDEIAADSAEAKTAPTPTPEMSSPLTTQPHHIKRVGVFVNKPAREVVPIALAAHLDAIQLHGDEDDAYIASLRDLLRAMYRSGSSPRQTPPQIIQAFRVQSADDVRRAQRSAADIILLDSGQGSGRTFDWSLLDHIDRPFILAGGLDPDNVAIAIDALHPWGVDMSSGVETDCVKDPIKMQKAVAAVHRTNTAEPLRSVAAHDRSCVLNSNSQTAPPL